MRNPFLIGERVYLRSMELSDVGEPYIQWLNTEGVSETLDVFFPSTRESLEEYVRKRLGSHSEVFFAIVLKEGDRFVGTAKLGPIEWVHRRASFGILIGDESVRNRGLGGEVVSLLLRYGFRILNLHKITAGCVGSNIRAIRCFEKVGMRIEGRRPEQLFVNGRYEDQVLLGILQEEYLKLGHSNG